MLQQTHNQQQQPMRRRARRHVAHHPAPAMQPQQKQTKDDVIFASRMIKFITLLFLAYIIIPTHWLTLIGGR